MKREFKVGDVVFLKSDSPAMTIAGICGDVYSIIPGKIRLSWFDDSKMEHAELPVECLLHEEDLFCDDEECVHCFPTSNCQRDNCPHCKEARADDDDDPNYLDPSPENN